MGLYSSRSPSVTLHKAICCAGAGITGVWMKAPCDGNCADAPWQLGRAVPGVGLCVDTWLQLHRVTTTTTTTRASPRPPVNVQCTLYSHQGSANQGSENVPLDIRYIYLVVVDSTR